MNEIVALLRIMSRVDKDSTAAFDLAGICTKHEV